MKRKPPSDTEVAVVPPDVWSAQAGHDANPAPSTKAFETNKRRLINGSSASYMAFVTSLLDKSYPAI